MRNHMSSEENSFRDQYNCSHESLSTIEESNNRSQNKKVQSEQNIHERERNYVQRIYNSLKFIKAVKHSEGKDPSNYIVTEKDKCILGYS